MLPKCPLSIDAFAKLVFIRMHRIKDEGLIAEILGPDIYDQTRYVWNRKELWSDHLARNEKRFKLEAFTEPDPEIKIIEDDDRKFFREKYNWVNIYDKSKQVREDYHIFYELVSALHTKEPKPNKWWRCSERWLVDCYEKYGYGAVCDFVIHPLSHIIRPCSGAPSFKLQRQLFGSNDDNFFITAKSTMSGVYYEPMMECLHMLINRGSKNWTTMFNKYADEHHLDNGFKFGVTKVALDLGIRGIFKGIFKKDIGGDGSALDHLFELHRHGGVKFMYDL